jgi:hypothetical protein
MKPATPMNRNPKDTSSGQEKIDQVEGRWSSLMKTAVPAAIATIIAAAISSSVSYSLTTSRLSYEESMEKARMFKELAFELQADASNVYPLLALWRNFPDERQLVVLTALREPSPEAIQFLVQAGFDNELKLFQDDIIHLFFQSGGQDRKLLWQILQVLDTDRVVELILSELKDSGDILPTNSLVGELSRLAQENDESKGKIIETFRAMDYTQFEGKMALAYILMTSGHEEFMREILEQTNRQIDLFPAVSQFLRRFPYSNLQADFRKQVINLSLLHFDSVSSQGADDSLYMYGLQLHRHLAPTFASDEQTRINVLESVYKIAIDEKLKSMMSRYEAVSLLRDLGDDERKVSALFRISNCIKDEQQRNHSIGILNISDFVSVPSDFESNSALDYINHLGDSRGLTCDD